MSEDLRQIRQLVEDYALAADDADGACASALFTPTGEMRIYMDPARPEEFTTTAASGMDRAWISLREYAATSHIIGAHSATIDGDRATAVTTCVAHHVRDWPAGRTDTVMHIRYEDAMVRTDGRWLFATRELHMKALATNAVLD